MTKPTTKNLHALQATPRKSLPKDGDFSTTSGGDRARLLDWFRRETPANWSRFLRAHFSSPAEVAVFFDRDEKTARNWWNGTHRPTSDVVLVALLDHPESLRAFMMAAE